MLSVMRVSKRALGLHALAVVLVPLALVARAPERPCPAPAAALAGPEQAAPVSRADAEGQRALAGIWWRYEPARRGEPVRFYYFHGDGTGLYRYGKLGLTNTHGFDYDVVGDRLVLDFRKSGAHHEVEFVVRHEGARDWLELRTDPREPGSTRYFRDAAGPIAREPEPAQAPPADLGPAPAGHMWMDLEAHATGGRTFAIYQLRPAGIDGRGVGWFHRGDFDDWSTEALTYRIAGDRLELDFTLQGASEATTFAVQGEGDARWLLLSDDPRDFWHPHRYRDVGPSFGAALGPFALAQAGS